MKNLVNKSHAVIFLLNFLFFSACGENLERKYPVDLPIPFSLEDAEKKESENIFVTAETKIKSRGGAGGCHAGAVCILIGAAIVYDVLFPEKYIQVDIHEDKRHAYSGQYTEKGEFISGVRFVKNEAEVYGIQRLSALGIEFPVQLQKGVVVDNEIQNIQKVSLIKQADYTEQYLEKTLESFEKDPDGFMDEYIDDREREEPASPFVYELIDIYKSDAGLILKKILNGDSVPEPVKGMFAEAIFQDTYGDTPAIFSEEFLLDAAKETSMYAAAEAFFYFADKNPDKAEFFMASLMKTVCGLDETENRFRYHILRRIQLDLPYQSRYKSSIPKNLVSCPDSPSVNLAKLALKVPVTEKQLYQLLDDASDGPAAVGYLNLRNSMHKRLLFQKWEKNPDMDLQNQLYDLNEIIKTNPSAAEGSDLIIIASSVSNSTAAGEEYKYSLLSHYCNGSFKKSGAVKKLKEKLNQTPEENKVFFELALFVMGEMDYRKQIQKRLLPEDDSDTVRLESFEESHVKWILENHHCTLPKIQKESQRLLQIIEKD